MTNVHESLRRFITENYLFGQAGALLADDTSFLDNGIIDSTGLLELIGFIERTYGIRLADEELVPENLDSLARIDRFLCRKFAAEPERVSSVGDL